MDMSQKRKNNDNIQIDLHTVCQLLGFHGVMPENVVTNLV